MGSSEQRYQHDLKIKIIGLVQPNEGLYNYRLEESKDRDYRNTVWASIARQCAPLTEAKVRRIWNQLRSSYRTALKNQNKKWRYFKVMRFLLPHIKPKSSRKPDTTTTTTTTVRNSNNEVITLDDDGDNLHNEDLNSDNHIYAQVIDPRVQSDYDDSTDALNKFFDYAYTATKEFPVNLQHQIRKSIFDMIHHMQQEAMEQ